MIELACRHSSGRKKQCVKNKNPRKKLKKLYESKHANFLVHGKEKQSRGRGEGLEASRVGYIHPATSDNLHFSTTTPGDG
jgi:hypothetical protein